MMLPNLLCPCARTQVMGLGEWLTNKDPQMRSAGTKLLAEVRAVALAIPILMYLHAVLSQCLTRCL